MRGKLLVLLFNLEKGAIFGWLPVFLMENLYAASALKRVLKWLPTLYLSKPSKEPAKPMYFSLNTSNLPKPQPPEIVQEKPIVEVKQVVTISEPTKTKKDKHAFSSNWISVHRKNQLNHMYIEFINHVKHCDTCNTLDTVSCEKGVEIYARSRKKLLDDLYSTPTTTPKNPAGFQSYSSATTKVPRSVRKFLNRAINDLRALTKQCKVICEQQGALPTTDAEQDNAGQNLGYLLGSLEESLFYAEETKEEIVKEANPNKQEKESTTKESADVQEVKKLID